jgi:hypothetical protein
MPYHEAGEVVILSFKNAAIDEQEEMETAAAASTTVEKVDPIKDGVPEKVDLSSAEGKRDEKYLLGTITVNFM